MRRRLAALACTALLPLGAFGKPPDDLDRHVARTMQHFEVPGMAVGIIENGATTHARGYGLLKLGSAQRVDEHTLFPIGSNTKAFTAAALAILVDRGKLGWDDRAVDRLPGFRMYDAYASQEMTVRDLLVHRSGLGLGAGDLLFFPPTNLTRAQIVERLRYIPPASSFRSRYAYDNILYIVAGELIARVAGVSWENFVQRELLQRAGMQDSVASFTAVNTPNRAWPHARLDGAIRGMGPVKPMEVLAGFENAAPAGSIGASAVDMARWLGTQLAQGALPGDGTRLFSEASAREMWTPHTLIPERPVPAPVALIKPTFATYALGWEVRDYRGHKIVTHSGGVEGSLSATVAIPEKQVGIAVMMNSEDGGARWAVFYRLLDHYLGLASPDWVDSFSRVQEDRLAQALAVLKERPAGRSDTRGPSLPIESYAGTYRDAWYGSIAIERDGAGLRVSFERSPGMSGALEHVRYDTFRTRFTDKRIEDAYVTFSLQPDGAIERVRMRAISPLADFSFDYHDLLFEPVKVQP
jgi:CubicO group peptidase (beta-lactamase class C family)